VFFSSLERSNVSPQRALVFWNVAQKKSHVAASQMPIVSGSPSNAQKESRNFRFGFFQT